MVNMVVNDYINNGDDFKVVQVKFDKLFLDVINLVQNELCWQVDEVFVGGEKKVIEDVVDVIKKCDFDVKWFDKIVDDVKDVVEK